jgi:intracellular multiplication protein IcmL
MSQDALLMIFERNDFYRRQYLLALGAFGLALLVIFILLWVLVYVVRNPTAPLYFATDNVGRLITVVPVSEPNMSTEDATKWAINAVQKAYSYDYVNYREQLQSAQKYFTVYGWTKFMAALKSSNNLVALSNRKMLIEAKIVGVPKLITEGRLSGAYAWKFEMPMLVTNYLPPYDAQSTFSNALTVSVLIQRQPILQSSDGVGIVQLIASMAAAQPQQAMPSMPSG